MAAWRKTDAAKAVVPNRYVLASAGDGGRSPKGYVPLALVGADGDGEERVLVHVRMLKEPCMAAMLQMAAQQFGYGQQGVLRIPCDGRQFHRMVSMMCSKAT